MSQERTRGVAKTQKRALPMTLILIILIINNRFVDFSLAVAAKGSSGTCSKRFWSTPRRQQTPPRCVPLLSSWTTSSVVSHVVSRVRAREPRRLKGWRRGDVLAAARIHSSDVDIFLFPGIPVVARCKYAMYILIPIGTPLAP